jgi:hypothetical protein
MESGPGMPDLRPGWSAWTKLRLFGNNPPSQSSYHSDMSLTVLGLAVAQFFPKDCFLLELNRVIKKKFRPTSPLLHGVVLPGFFE